MENFNRKIKRERKKRNTFQNGGVEVIREVR